MAEKASWLHELPLPKLLCRAEDKEISTGCITTTVNLMLKELNAVSKKKFSGYEFFGFYRKKSLKSSR